MKKLSELEIVTAIDNRKPARLNETIQRANKSTSNSAKMQSVNARTKLLVTRIWERMGKIYKALWLKQNGEAGGEDWEMWCSALDKVCEGDIASAVNRIAHEMPEYPPSLPRFLKLCGLDLEKSIGLPGKELAFPYMMNFVSKPANKFGGQRDFSELNGAYYWIYQNLDIYVIKGSELRDQRKIFNLIYDKCIELATTGHEFIEPPKLIEDGKAQKEREYREKRKDPVYVSKNKKIGMSALAQMRRGLA